MQLTFVTPALSGPITGGTLYNLQLIAALKARGLTARQCTLEDAAHPLDADWVWLDSLYLAQLPALRARLTPRARLGLLLHYLPSLLERPDPRSLNELSDVEQRALLGADRIVTPSESLRASLLRLHPTAACVSCEPGVELVPRRAPAERERTAVMVCNITPNKGVLELLHALAPLVQTSDDFALEIAGRLDLEPAYAARCTALCAQEPWLRARVRWLGGLSPRGALEHVARASVLVSASRSESYGMAIAEARAHGTPVLARTGGHVAALVAADSGGELTADAAALARGLLALMRARDELAQRLDLAARDTPARSWAETAEAFEYACRAHDPAATNRRSPCAP